jgi:hypothetical protein
VTSSSTTTRARPEDSTPARFADVPVRAITALMLLPVLVLGGRALFQHWLPVGDVATIGLRTSEVFTSHSPLVGPYSHFGWSHPGPMLFEVLAVPSRLLGQGNNGLLLGALIVNGVALVVIVTRLFRFGGVLLASLGVVCFGLVVWSLGTSWLWYPWNPNVAMLPFAALLVIAWTTARNCTWDLLLLAVFASFVLQTHVAYVPFVVVLVPIALIGRARRVAPETSRKGRTRSIPPQTPTVVAAFALVVAWFPPVLDAVLHGGGNLRDLLDFWLSDHQTFGLGPALRVMGLELSLHGSWLGYTEPTFIGAVAPPRLPVPAALILLLVAAGVAWRAQDTIALRGCVVVLAAIGVGTLAIARIVGLAYPYLLFSTRVLAASAWLVAGWTLLRALERKVGLTSRWAIGAVAATAAVAMVAVLTTSAITAGIGPRAEEQDAARVARVAGQVADALGDTDREIGIASTDSFSGGTFKAGLMLALTERGYSVHTDRSDRVRLGSHFANSAPTAIQLLLTAGSQQFADNESFGRVIAESSPPLLFPASAPTPKAGEDPHAYLARVKDSVDRQTFRQLVAYLTRPAPVAVLQRNR